MWIGMNYILKMEKFKKLMSSSDVDFINKLKRSKFFDLMFDKPEVVLIVLCGSRITGVIDNHSDYDITVLTTNENLEPSDYRLGYNGKEVHWYYQNIYKFVSNDETKPTMFFLCPLLMGCLRSEYVIYTNPKYHEVLDYLLSVQTQLQEIGGRMLYKKCLSYITLPLKDNHIDKKYYTKFWGQLVLASYVLKKEKINKSLVLAAKRIKYKEMTDGVMNSVIERVRILEQYVKTVFFDMEKNIKEINDNIKKLIVKQE